MNGTSAPIEKLTVDAFRIPTDAPESDGTYEWDATTIVVVHVFAGGTRGIGYTYADAAAANIIHADLVKTILGKDAMDVPLCWHSMRHAIRNNGDLGLCMMAVSAVDNALWDLKARLLDISLVSLLGAVRKSVPVYGSGGFTSYTIDRLCEQLSSWVEQGIRFVKMKIGRDTEADPHRVHAARQAIGPRAGLFVDANGGYSRKQALGLAYRFANDDDVIWFEEPVVHHDLEGLRLIRDRAPAGMDISIGEYGFENTYFQRVLVAGATDVLQADVTRCGITTFLETAALCSAWHIPLSSHCAPSLHVPVCCSAEPVRHIEYFYDHVRIEHMLFEGVPQLINGALEADLSRPGNGLELKWADARHFQL